MGAHRLQGFASWFLLLVAALAAAPPQAAAGEPGRTASVHVRVNVARQVTVRMALPSALMITEADVARGYVEVAAPVPVDVTGNVAEGYSLVFEHFGDYVRQTQVQGLGNPLVLSDRAVASRQPAGRGFWRDLLQLRFRFDLAPGVQAGQHPWPMQISMMSH